MTLDFLDSVAAWIIIPLMFLFGLLFLSIGFSELRKRRLIENIPTSNIRGMAMGLVEIAGEVTSPKGTMLKSPLTNHDCVYYGVEVYEPGTRGGWSVVEEVEQRVPFHLKDATGSVLVDSKEAEVDIKEDAEIIIGPRKAPPPRVRQFLEQHKIGFKWPTGATKRLRLIERYLARGDKLYVMGTAGKSLHERGRAQTSADAIVIQQGENEKLYYISDAHERNVLEKLRKSAPAYWLVGATLTMFSIIVTLAALDIPLDEVTAWWAIGIGFGLNMLLVAGFWFLKKSENG